METASCRRLQDPAAEEPAGIEGLPVPDPGRGQAAGRRGEVKTSARTSTCSPVLPRRQLAPGHETSPVRVKRQEPDRAASRQRSPARDRELIPGPDQRRDEPRRHDVVRDAVGSTPYAVRLGKIHAAMIPVGWTG